MKPAPVAGFFLPLICVLYFFREFMEMNNLLHNSANIRAAAVFPCQKVYYGLLNHALFRMSSQ
ncbi:hypothetical protein D3C84_386260 [compost metagenome]